MSYIPKIFFSIQISWNHNSSLVWSSDLSYLGIYLGLNKWLFPFRDKGKSDRTIERFNRIIAYPNMGIADFNIRGIVVIAASPYDGTNSRRRMLFQALPFSEAQ